MSLEPQLRTPQSDGIVALAVLKKAAGARGRGWWGLWGAKPDTTRWRVPAVGRGEAYAQAGAGRTALDGPSGRRRGERPASGDCQVNGLARRWGRAVGLDGASAVVPQQLGRRPVYLTQPPDPDRPRRSQLVLAPAGDLWVVVGRRASLPDGVLLQGSDGRIHVLDQGRRRWIASVAVFECRGFRWEQVRLTPDDVLDDIPEDDALTE
jgi:hypothetical protein